MMMSLIKTSSSLTSQVRHRLHASTRLLHASYTPLAHLLHASYTPLLRLLHASYMSLTRLLHTCTRLLDEFDQDDFELDKACYAQKEYVSRPHSTSMS
jgi:hypothetical protein